MDNYAASCYTGEAYNKESIVDQLKRSNMSTKYEFKSTHIDGRGFETITTKEFHEEYLGSIIDEISDFLLGVGFPPKLVKEYLSNDENQELREQIAHLETLLINSPSVKTLT